MPVTENAGEAKFKDWKSLFHGSHGSFPCIPFISALLPWLILAHDLEKPGAQALTPLARADARSCPGRKPDSLLCLQAFASSDQRTPSWQ